MHTPEYRQVLVDDVYGSDLHRTVDPLGQSVWPVFLQEGVRDEVVLAMILSDHQQEFFNKTAP